ncbi:MULTISPECIES: YceI family protein [Bartonella]|uniref:Polyisoprenoid-binding protein YceI n=1 Tax=Bartonella choladocola TaxID=2750995 RepID=A0A1U9MIE5_9HYPH|nr:MULTISPECIES: YceI family protein [Bartonella]AQT47675.1 Polyisoprenoid-binding protein YceI [Bartonella choladocola]MBH9975844.1 polyisoprenoid-binding protein [Bartonella choladocola]MBI0015451.1 polyisoprenoid-binding protein [Bartonella sp. B10834G3]
MFINKTTIAAAFVVPCIFWGASAGKAAKLDVPTGAYVSDAAHTNLLWSIKHFGLSNYYGRFDKIEAKLDLDANDVEKSVLHVRIDPKSVDTNYPKTPNEFNDEIAGEMFFDADKYKNITFDSTSIELTGEKTGKVTGNLTFHGVTKPVVLDVTLNGTLASHPMTKKPALGFSAKTVIKRSEFGVNELEGPLSDDVNLTIEAEFKPAE